MTKDKKLIYFKIYIRIKYGNEFVTFIKTLQGCKIEIENEAGKRVNASSLLKVLSLGVKKGSVLTIYCDGENVEDYLKKVEEFISNFKV